MSGDPLFRTCRGSVVCGSVSERDGLRPGGVRTRRDDRRRNIRCRERAEQPPDLVVVVSNDGTWRENIGGDDRRAVRGDRNASRCAATPNRSVSPGSVIRLQTKIFIASLARTASTMPGTTSVASTLV